MEYVRSDLYKDILSSSNVVTGDEYRDLVCAVAQVASDMVVKTLGPYGATTVIDDGSGFSYPSKDGWTCLSKLMFTDPTYNSIFQMLKKISFNSVSTVGDGTTSAMVAANNFLRAIYTDFIPKITKSGQAFRQATFVESMQKVYKELEEQLKSNPRIRRIDLNGDFEDIYRIAYVATNGNEGFSRLIQKVYQETKNPNIQVTLDGNSAETTIEIQKGYKFDAHVLNFDAYQNDDSGLIVYKDAPRKVIIFDHNVTFQSHEQIIGALIRMASRDGFSVMILAPYFDDIVTSWMASQTQRLLQARQIPNVMMVQVPISMDIHRKTLADLTVLTNTQVFTDGMVRAHNILLHNQTHEEKDQIPVDEALQSLIDDYKFVSPELVISSCLGSVRSIIFNRHGEGFLQDYQEIYNPTVYNTMIQEVTDEYNAKKKKALKTVGGTLDKDYLFTQLRYIKLTGSMGVIKVGNLTDMQQHTDKDTIDDAVLACRSAFENGYVRGMNLEILSILHQAIEHDMNDAKQLMPYTQKYEYYSEILYMLYNCFYLTSYQVIQNKHRDDSTARRIEVQDRVYDDGNPEMPKIKPIVFNWTSSQILENCIKDPVGYDYNLREETLHTPEFWNVINSTATDIEILRAVVNVLTTVVTSNQFLSATRRFDQEATNEKSMRARLNEDMRFQTNRVNATLQAIVESPYKDKLEQFFGGKLMFPMVKDIVTDPIETVPLSTIKETPTGMDISYKESSVIRDPENGQI